MRVVSDIMGFFHRLVREPAAELRGARAWLRFVIDLVRHCGRELYADGAEQMAAALTYRTIFSLVPMFLLSLIVLQTFGALEQRVVQIEDTILRWGGLTALTYESPEYYEDVEEAPLPEPWTAAPEEGVVQLPPGVLETEEKQEGAREGIQHIIRALIERVQKLDFTSIGVIGLIVLVWAALNLAIALESNFNTIYNAPQARPWHLRVSIYWAAITLGPVLLFVSLYVAGRLAEMVERFGTGLAADPTRPVLLGYLGVLVIAVLQLLSRFTALAASWLLLFLLFRLMPNTRVAIRPALIGSFVAACLWEVGKWGFQLYVQRALPYSAIYGSLGLIPLFLFWVYITWIIVLFGLELTYTLQAMKSGRFKTIERTRLDVFFDTRALVPMMVLIGRAFRDGKPVGSDDLSRELAMTERAVAAAADRLEKERFILEIGTEDGSAKAYTLARPADTIHINALLQLGQKLPQKPVEEIAGPTAGWFRRIDNQVAAAVGATTLADLVTADLKDH